MVSAAYTDRGDPLTTYQAQVVRALQIATGITVYDGEVPDEVEEDANGYIAPYVVVFSSDGDSFDEVDLSGRRDLAGLRWDFQTTSVGASADIAARVARTVRRTLTNFPLGTYHVLPPEGYTGAQAPMKDPGTNPARYFLPRQWRLDTT